LVLFDNRSHKKNGAPIIDVMTPTGISTGENIVRLKVSQKTRNIPPNINATGPRTL
jgi:hypothetical protein